MIKNVKILMLKGQKGEKGDKGDKGNDGENYYDDTEIRQMIADETLAREQADGTLENTKADVTDLTSLSNTVNGLSEDISTVGQNLSTLANDFNNEKTLNDNFKWKLHGVMAEEVDISGTTDSSGFLTVPIINTYNHRPYILTNFSDTLANAYVLTVNSGTSGTIKVRVRAMGTNQLVAGLQVSTRALIIGF